jgi:hypothetical protein
MVIINSLSVSLRRQLIQFRRLPAGFILLLASYGFIVFGSPMPPIITWVEILMGFGLLLGGVLLGSSILKEAKHHVLERWVIILTISLLIVPLIWGLYCGNTPQNVARDVFPLMFLLGIPILLTAPTQHANHYILVRLVVFTVLMVGVISAATFFWGIFDLFGSPSHLQKMMSSGYSVSAQAAQATQFSQATQAAQEPLRVLVFLKVYDPAILFTSIFFSAWGIIFLIRSWRSSLLGFVLLACGVTIAYGFMIIGLRAYSAFYVLALMIICSTQLKQMGFYLRILPLATIGLFLILPDILAIIHLLWSKQQMMGTNGKVVEWNAVLSTITATPQTLLLGVGWGGIFENPIFNETTRFTHSMLSFFLIKTGAVGTFAFILTTVMLMLRTKRRYAVTSLSIERFILLLSCVPPLVIGILFEPTYKMLSYGVILALFILSLPAANHKSS